MRPRYPVILCGGAGHRLWPASGATTPKPFLNLTGPLSLFQLAVRRAAPLATGGGRVLVVGQATHQALIEAQLGALGVDAVLMLETEGRDSGPAIAAAASWIARRDPDAVALILASDHHIPDEAAYRRALQTAADAADAHSAIVTLGVRPASPSTAYGYIRAADEGLSPVAAFVEKPDAAGAARLIADGCLWNSGAFIAPAALLRAEFERHAPEMAVAAADALPDTDAAVFALGPAFATAPKLSVDYAVMERTDRAWVLPIDLEWSDLGAWDAVAAAAPRAPDAQIDGDGCWVRAPDGVTVATVGVSNVAVVVENGAVLVCDLGSAQGVRKAAASVRKDG